MTDSKSSKKKKNTYTYVIKQEAELWNECLYLIITACHIKTE